MHNERQEHILDLIDSKGSITLGELEETFPNVSSMTLRRDLILLENEQHIIRTKGGAVSSSRINIQSRDEPIYSFRELENMGAKKEIAMKALRYVERGRSMYLDSGSTLMCLAKVMEDEAYTIITSGLNIAVELLKKQKPSVISLGGSVNRNTISVSGPESIEHMSRINIDIAFMSASGYSEENGFTVSNVFESELKRSIIKKAKKVIMLMDSSKIDKILAFTFASRSDVDVVILENDTAL